MRCPLSAICCAMRPDAPNPSRHLWVLARVLRGVFRDLNIGNRQLPLGRGVQEAKAACEAGFLKARESVAIFFSSPAAFSQSFPQGRLVCSFSQRPGTRIMMHQAAELVQTLG